MRRPHISACLVRFAFVCCFTCVVGRPTFVTSSQKGLTNTAHLSRFNCCLDANPVRPGGSITASGTEELRVSRKLSALRGGAHFNRKRAWETAVKRGKGGFPGPTSWDPMEQEALRIKTETLLAPEVQRCMIFFLSLEEQHHQMLLSAGMGVV